MENKVTFMTNVKILNPEKSLIKEKNPIEIHQKFMYNCHTILCIIKLTKLKNKIQSNSEMNTYSLVYTGENINWYILLVRIYIKKIRYAHKGTY